MDLRVDANEAWLPAEAPAKIPSSRLTPVISHQRIGAITWR